MNRRDRRERRASAEINAVTEKIIGAAMRGHRSLGPGLLESTYESCLRFELTRQGSLVEHQKPQPVTYDGLLIDCGYRLDLLVDEEVVVEVKAVKELGAVHEAQLLTYLRLSGKQVGLLINFNVRVLKDGIRRLVSDFRE